MSRGGVELTGHMMQLFSYPFTLPQDLPACGPHRLLLTAHTTSLTAFLSSTCRLRGSCLRGHIARGMGISCSILWLRLSGKRVVALASGASCMQSTLHDQLVPASIMGLRMNAGPHSTLTSALPRPMDTTLTLSRSSPRCGSACTYMCARS